MTIHVEHASGGFLVTVMPTEHKTVSWTAAQPMTRDDLIEKLIELGFHLQDIVDALHFADMDQPGTT
jgi:uncharacterized protein Smg (DUF494 family)